jgi:DNA replication licensing factor MCM4
MNLIHNRCEFADRQVVRLQETPDAVPDGQTPHTVSLCVYDELVDIAKPGDRLTVTGIFRSVPVRINPRQRTIKSLFKTYLDVVQMKRGSKDRLGFDRSTRTNEARIPGVGAIGVGGGEDEDEGEVQAELREAEDDGESISKRTRLEAELRQLSQRTDIYELLARSLAPSIWEMEDVKKGILLQLFGGTNKSISKGGGGGGPRYRGDINVLLVGDPGTSKSQILQVSSSGNCKEKSGSRFTVRAQIGSARGIHLRQRFVRCWVDGIRDSRSGLEATRAREVRESVF